MSAATMTGEQLYATLLLNDSYLPGALVLAHSLRDAGTTKKLAVLVTLDSVSADAITQLKEVYDYILPVPRIRNEQPANLHLMNRSDLHSAFTKINLWKQTQFSKIVYIDADVVAYRAPDELFELPHAFSAAPDIGWPDLVNTGVMVLTPNMGDYYAMLAMAERGISFDGADQGLINMHFKHSVNRLSFTYNVTPSAHYQYIPAYRHFQSSISMVHFIGANKPWFSGRSASIGNTPFDEMIGRWWAVYDHHYRAKESAAKSYSRQSTGHYSIHEQRDSSAPTTESVSHMHPGSDKGNHPHETYITPERAEHPTPQEAISGSNSNASYPIQSTPSAQNEGDSVAGTSAEHHDLGQHETMKNPAPQDQRHSPAAVAPSWDAQRHPPPSDSKPEAIDFPSTHYEMSRDTAPFVPPVRYPSPPKDMWYDVPKEQPSPTKQPRQIFPWESHQPAPTRTFVTAPVYESPGSPQVGESGGNYQEPVTAEAHNAPPGQQMTELSTSDVENQGATGTGIGGIFTPTSGDPWGSYSRVNAWDDVPEISRYVEGLHRHRRTRSQMKGGSTATSSSPGVFGGALPTPKAFRVTDFPTEVERPSLPVTPAPIRRPSFWGPDSERLDLAGEVSSLPIAEGVPSQSEWVCVHGRRWGPADCRCDLADLGVRCKDPASQLQMLAQQQSEALLRRLSGDNGLPGRKSSHDIPSRSLPFGSQHVPSPTYVAQSAPTSVLSPQPVQGKSATAGIVRDLTGSDDPSPEDGTREESMAPHVGGSADGSPLQ